jgi:hypothetical protein
MACLWADTLGEAHVSPQHSCARASSGAQEMAERYEEQLKAAQASLAAATQSVDEQKAAAAAASTAATAACEREALLKQALHDAEERSAHATSDLGASHRRV